MNQHSMLPRHSAITGRRFGRGFTLIEMMVAMLLGLIVIAGVSSVFLANMRSYHANTALGDVQSNARIAFELMARDIRQAGLTGCNSTSGRVANVLKNKSTEWWANWGNAVHGYEDGSTQDPAVDKGTGEGQRVANTDSLEILGISGMDVTIVPTNGNNPAELSLNKPTSDLKTGDIVLICDPDHSVIAQVTTYNGDVTVTHNTGTGSPGNCSKGLGYPTVCSGNANGNAYTFGTNSQIALLTAHDWYIGNNPDGGRSLYRITVTNNAGALSATAQEMVRNVTDMQIWYHQGNENEYIEADSSSPAINWGTVDAVRIKFTLQSADQRAGTDAKPLTRHFTSTTTIRNRVN